MKVIAGRCRDARHLYASVCLGRISSKILLTWLYLWMRMLSCWVARMFAANPPLVAIIEHGILRYVPPVSLNFYFYDQRTTYLLFWNDATSFLVRNKIFLTLFKLYQIDSSSDIFWKRKNLLLMVANGLMNPIVWTEVEKMLPRIWRSCTDVCFGVFHIWWT